MEVIHCACGIYSFRVGLLAVYCGMEFTGMEFTVAWTQGPAGLHDFSVSKIKHEKTH